MTLTSEPDPYSVTMNQHTKYLGQMLSSSKTLSSEHTHHTNCSTWTTKVVCKITSGQSNLTTGRTAASHGLDGSLVFVSWRQYAPHASLNHNPSPNPKQHIDRFSRFLHGSVYSDTQRDRPTNRPRYSVSNNRHLRT